MGGAFGLFTASRASPGLSLPIIIHSAIVGWLIGLVSACAIAWLLSHRPQVGNKESSSRQQRLHIAMLIITLTPAMLWIIFSLLSDNLIRKNKVTTPLKKQPNIILISIDTLRADHIGVYGDTRGLTPNIDKFALNSTRYENAIAAGSWTMPSFAAIFTQVRPSECGMKLPVLDSKKYIDLAALTKDVPLLSERLHTAGYTTAAELTNIFLSPERGWNRGFDYFQNERNKADPYHKRTLAASITQYTESWMKIHHRQPFFLWVHYIDPHIPYDSPDTPAQLRTQYPAKWKADRKTWYEQMQSADPKTKMRYQQFCRMMYAEEVRYVDKWVGHLLESIKSSGLYDNSLIVIMSDHGEELFDHGAFEHGHTMYNELLRVPLLVKWPYGPQFDPVISQTVSLADMGGTLLSLASVSPSAGMKWHVLPKYNQGKGKEVYSEGLLYGIEQTALTNDTRKVIYQPKSLTGKPRFEVYNLRTDKNEQKNIAGKSTALDACRRLEIMTADSLRIAQHIYTKERSSTSRKRLSENTKRNLRSLGYLGN